MDTLYARWLAGDLTPEEIAAMKASGEWDELTKIIEATNKLSLPTYDKDAAFKRLQQRNRNKSKGIAMDSGKQVNESKHTPSKVRSIEETPSRTTAKVRSIEEAPSRRNWLSLVGIAATLFLIAGALFWFLPRTVSVESALAQTQTHTFPDKSSVILNAASSLSYSKNFASNRTVKLEGEAVFSVQKGSSPFKVMTDNGVVEVLGTEFNVREWGKNLYVECYEGKVKVSNAKSEAILTPGESINIVNGKMREEGKINHQQATWTQGTSKFYEEDVNTVLEELGRQYAVGINAPGLAKRFTGSFTHESLEEALKQVCKPMGLTYQISEDKKTIEIKK